MDNQAEDQLIRLQKVITQNGLCSRREAEVWIEEGLILVNGKTAVLGQKVNPLVDTIKVNGHILPKTLPARIVLVMNKPTGYICSHGDPHHNQTIYSLLPERYSKTKLICCGRLDKDSEGLVILTNDGALAQSIMHPSSAVIKRYYVTLNRPFDTSLISRLLEGIYDEGEHLYLSKIFVEKSNHARGRRLEVHLEQGKKREIRRLFQTFGFFVEELKRFQIGRYLLKGVSKGHVHELSEKEIASLLK